MNNITDIAQIAHEVNAAFCKSIGDDSQSTWEDAPEWQKESALAGVHFHIDNPDAPASASHDSWMTQKLNDGWIYGPVKDPELKQHPCIVPFSELPKEQQAKDYIFSSVVFCMEQMSSTPTGDDVKRMAYDVVGAYLAPRGVLLPSWDDLTEHQRRSLERLVSGAYVARPDFVNELPEEHMASAYAIVQAIYDAELFWNIPVYTTEIRSEA